MMSTEYQEEPLSEALERLNAAGYTQDFRGEKEGLRDVVGGKIYRTESLHVDEVVRFEGTTNPDEEAILFALRSEDGVRGTYVVTYGPSVDPVDAEIVQKLRVPDQP